MTPIVDRMGNVRLPEGPDIVITTGHLVGLGDHSIYTTLPRRFSELGYKVYVDQDNAARNDEIIDLLWNRNPHVLGTSDKKPNAGHVRQGLFYELANRFPVGSIEAMERAHGLPPPYSIAPYINYEPNAFHIDVSRHVLMDFSAVSSSIDDQGLAEFIRAMRGKFRNAPLLQLIMPKWAALHSARIQNESVQINSIYQYLDALYACRGWIGGEAGGQSLAAAVRGEHPLADFDARPEISVLMTPPTFNDRGYVYAGVDYRVTGFGRDNESDWHFPVEMQTHTLSLHSAMNVEYLRAQA